MYRAIVASKVRGTFKRLSAGEPAALTEQLASRFVYEFRGENPLGGRRTSTATMDEWFARVYRLFPGLQFEVLSVAVSGLPAHTTALTHVEISAEGGYQNEMFQKITLRWGRITNVVTLENLVVLDDYLSEAAGRGVIEATAAPLLD